MLYNQLYNKLLAVYAANPPYVEVVQLKSKTYNKRTTFRHVKML